MISFKLSDVVIKLDFSFFAIFTLFLCFDATGYGLMSIAACLFHECGHIAVMVYQGNSPSEMTFYGGGIKLSGMDKGNDLLVIIAGSLVNFVLAGGAFIFSDGSSIYPLIFATLNLIIGVLNLLPVGYLDGKRLLELVCLKRCSAAQTIWILKAAETVSVVLMAGIGILLFLSGYINFTVVIMLIYLFVLDILPKI